MELGKLPLGAGVLLASLVACGGPQGRGGPGATCFRDDECEFGLVCAAVGSGERTCTSDVNALVEQYVPEGLPVPVAGGTTSGGAANGGESGGAPGGGTAGGGAPTMAGAPATGGAPSMAGAPATPSGGSTSAPSGGSPSDMAAGTSG
jgi:hypothetical protein